MSLGRVIVALYLMTLLAAVISARVLQDEKAGEAGARAPEPTVSPSTITSR